MKTPHPLVRWLLVILAFTVGRAQTPAQDDPENPAMVFRAPTNPWEKPEFEFFTAMVAAKTAYRRSLADALQNADDVQLFLLDFKTQPVKNSKDSHWENSLPLDLFPIVTRNEVSKILQRRQLPPAERKAFLLGLKRVLSIDGVHTGGMCHLPTYGIRIWAGNYVVFQTSLSTCCGNLEVTYPTQGAEPMGYHDPDFEAILQRALPIPQSEIDRFEESKKHFFLK